jgi:hypothetical protein
MKGTRDPNRRKVAAPSFLLFDLPPSPIRV